jgi:hypothetical protein
MGSLKVAVIAVLKATPVAPFSGLVDITSGHTPTIPDSSLTFLQPAAEMTSNIKIKYLLKNLKRGL